MSWKNKVSFDEMLDFCIIFRDRNEIMKKFNMTRVESVHCFNWFGRFRDDFLVEEKRGVTGKAVWMKTLK